MWLDQLLALRFRGMGRVRSSLRGAHPTTLIRRRSVDGLLFGLDPESFMDRFVIDAGYWEREVLDAILECLYDDGVLWDIGTNLGLHAVTAKHFRPKAKVIAFEPSPFTAARAKMNAEMNKLDVEVCSVALGSQPGYSQLSVKLASNSGLSSLSPWPHTSYDGTILCRVERGDILVSSGAISSPTVIKIDVEGFEMQVLEGMTEILKSPRLKAVIFESHDGDLSVGHLLEEKGMRIRRLPPANVLENGGPLSPNYLAVR